MPKQSREVTLFERCTVLLRLPYVELHNFGFVTHFTNSCHDKFGRFSGQLARNQAPSQNSWKWAGGSFLERTVE